MGHACMGVEAVQGYLQKSSGTQIFAVRSFVPSKRRLLLNSLELCTCCTKLNIATL